MAAFLARSFCSICISLMASIWAIRCRISTISWRIARFWLCIAVICSANC